LNNAIQLINSAQTKIRFDVYIVGFELDVSIIAGNPFKISSAINYATGDTGSTGYAYSTLLSGNSGKAVTTYVSSTSKNSINLIFNFLGTLNNVVITYISHPILSTSLTTGYNTYFNSEVTPTSGFSLFNSVNNLNNLGSLNVVAFYGLTTIDLVSTTSLSTQIDIQYSYTTFVTTYGSTVNNIGASYYFYEPLSTSIINN
jgi:hypothetical protein